MLRGPGKPFRVVRWSLTWRAPRHHVLGSVTVDTSVSLVHSGRASVWDGQGDCKWR